MKILTFDIEEWFHILDHNSTRSVKDWEYFESRIHLNMDLIFEVLNKSNVKATFFCVGWIAEKYPDIIKAIVNNGYEIGSHTRMHQLVYTQNPKEFRKDVGHSIETLQDLSGDKIKYFRAPGFSITEKNIWAFEILANLGIEIDCSIFPASRAHGGFQNFGAPIPSILEYSGIKIKEMPINYIRIFNKPVVFSGGGYFRFFPYPLIKEWTKSSEYIMTYFHPRDFDSGQPIIQDLSRVRRFKSYVGIKRTKGKVERWLQDFEFTDIGTADSEIDWKKVPVIKL